MSRRIKATTFATRTDFYAAIDEIARRTVTVRLREAQRDKELQGVREEHDGVIAAHNLVINNLAIAAEKYAEEHRAELLPDKLKSTETVQAIFGFRTGNRTLVTLAKWTWKKVLVALDARGLKDCIRVKTEVNKEAILAAGAKGSIEYKLEEVDLVVPLSALGVKIVQEETFFIEAKEQPGL